MPYKDKSRDETKYIKDPYQNKDMGILEGVIAAAAAIALGTGAVKSGVARPLIEGVIKNLGKYKGTHLSSLSQGLKVWSRDTEDVTESVLRSSWLKNIINVSNPARRALTLEHTATDFGKMKNYMSIANRTRVSSARDGIQKIGDDGRLHWLYSDPEFVSSYKNLIKIEKDILSKDSNVHMISKMHDELLNKFKVETSAQNKMMEQFGYRKLTLHDVASKKNLDKIVDNKTAAAISSRLYNYIDDFTASSKNVFLDKNLLINKTGDIADLRVYSNSIRKSMKTASDEFGIPFIGLNPLKLFYVNRAFEKTKPLFAILEKGTIQPVTHGLDEIPGVLSGKLDPLQDDLYYIAGNIFSKGDLNKPIVKGVHLEDINAGRSTVAKYIRSMAGLKLKDFEKYGGVK